MRSIEIHQPRKLVFGSGCIQQCSEDLIRLGLRKVLLITSSATAELANPLIASLQNNGVAVTSYCRIDKEPTVESFEEALAASRRVNPDAVIGIGGGSALDVSKLVAALTNGSQTIWEVFGIGLLAGRSTTLICLPTTSGTGSEVSPNAILLDEEEQLKKGVISPFLVPDATYVDPQLTITMPRMVTAGTGLDALTHCVEAYTNKFAHPMVDVYALEGIRLANKYLPRAINEPENLQAREGMSLSSLYGGLCLGPVNTAAVHALSYPLGSEFHIAHGISNAVLLPYVSEFNLASAPERYAEVAIALGAEKAANPLETAKRGVERMHALLKECGVPTRLQDFKLEESIIPRMAESAMKITRLLKNNPREVTHRDAEQIYQAAFS